MVLKINRAYDSRHTCDKCGTTMEDIENVRFHKFEHCKTCRDYAVECWRFAVACVPEAANMMLELLGRNRPKRVGGSRQ